MAQSTGPLISKNNLKGFQVAEAVLINTVASVWTHNFNAIPVAITCYAMSSGALCLTTQPAVTSNANAITLTPTSSINARVYIQWNYDQVPQGIPPTNFV